MLGAIAGDIIGSIYEWNDPEVDDFPLFRDYSNFTDDTVMTIAVADCLIHEKEYAPTLRAWGQKYPLRGYGGNFKKWLAGLVKGPYNSWGNGSAMRVSSIGWAMDSIEMVLEEAQKSAEITHNHPEGIKGAQAIALALFLARQDTSKSDIQIAIEQRFDYNLGRTLESIRPEYKFDVSCQGSVPEAIIAFLESNNLESAIRNAILLGGDSDTLACMAGGIAEAYYKEVPPEIEQEVWQRLPEEMQHILDLFSDKFINR